MSKFPPASSAPAPLIKQRAMAASRAAAAEFMKPEDRASMVGSTPSWSLLHEQPGQATGSGFYRQLVQQFWNTATLTRHEVAESGTNCSASVCG